MAELQPVVDAYEFHRLSCIAAAEAWERAAETQRTQGNLSLAFSCSQNAIRMRWLAEPDEDLRELFNAADRLLEEMPRD